MTTRTVGSGKDYSTIAAALSAANADDTISIDAGTYTEYHLDVYDDGLTIKAADATAGAPTENAVILDGEESTSKEYAFYSYASGCLYQHITFKNYEEYAIRRGSTDGASLTLSGCLIYGCDGPAISHVGYNASTPTEIYDSIIIVDEGRAINVGGDSTVIIQNSVLATNNNDEAVLMSSISYPNVTASHCTFIGRGSNGSDGRHYHLVSQVAKVNNCIVYGGDGHGIQANHHNNNLVYVTHAESNAYVEWEAATYDSDAVSAGTGDLTGNPTFVATPTQGSITPGLDLRLQKTSPAVDAGAIASPPTLTDLSGNLRDSLVSRVLTYDPDIGAIEYLRSASDYQSYGTSSNVRFRNTGEILLTTEKISDEYKKLEGIDQAPFSLTARGIIFRNRPKPYIVSTHDDPDSHFSGSS
tara:strand:- start:1173 stop:2414 length:1242 start_codon:yes stop_codon:yes gene_type:complete